LKKRTSINSNFRFHKEKEMADFRRYLYALAVVALLAGLTVPASAQQAFQCTNSTGVPPVVRAEGYAELMGDLVLDCTGGIPTPPNQTVPTVNIAVNLDTYVSSKTTAVLSNVEFLESLLIIDEPNSPTNPARQILNCGRTEALDSTAAGAGVCSILGGGANGAQNTYSGLQDHPNVFQGRSFRLITGQTNQVVFSAVPIDPPGTICANTNPSGDLTTFIAGVCHRIVRITNIRGDASSKGVATGNQTSTITSDLIVNPSTGLPVDNPTHVVARVQLGLVGPALKKAKLDFIQCKTLESQDQSGLVYTFKEGFENAFKPQSLTQVLLNGVAKPSYSYNLGTSPDTTQGVANNQNVAGAVYDTESGYVNGLLASTGDNPSNALTGGTSAGIPFSNSGSTYNTGIVNSGTATQGTRLMISFSNIPNGSYVSAPNIVQLTNVITQVASTGVAVLINNTSSSGFGGTPAGTSGTSIVAGIAGGITYPNRAVYEVFFSNPGALEQLAVQLSVFGTPNLPSNLPQPNTVSQIQGNFAPYYEPALNIRETAYAAGSEDTVHTPAVLAIPRFNRLVSPVDFYAIARCSCNLLFPFVTNAPSSGGNYDTGLAIANTSLDPGNKSPTVYGFLASAQSGPVQLWYYNRNAAVPAEPSFLGQGNTQCANVTTPGSCDAATKTDIAPGGMLTYVLSTGGYIQPSSSVAGPPVLLGASGFQGYIIAQTGFQYCHGFAFIQKQGAGFEADQAFMGYLAIVLDQEPLARTNSLGENDGH
jgi:hypothetical protein